MVTVDSHGFPMRDDLDQLQTTKRTAYAGEFYLKDGRSLRRLKRLKKGRLKGEGKGVSETD